MTWISSVSLQKSNAIASTHGRIRVSLRDYRKSGTNDIYQRPNDAPRYPNESDIIPADIPFWPTAIHYEDGEQLTFLFKDGNHESSRVLLTRGNILSTLAGDTIPTLVSPWCNLEQFFFVRFWDVIPGLYLISYVNSI